MPVKLFTKEDIPIKCPHCRRYLSGNLKCLYCKKLADEGVAGIKVESKDRIYGGIYSYVFSRDKNTVAFVTEGAGSKNPNFYLYDLKSQKIIWSKKKQYRVDRMLFLEDRIIIISRTFRISTMESFYVNSGVLVTKIDKEETWTNILQFKNDFLIGFRDGFLYRYDKNLTIVNTICLKENPEEKEWSYYSNPAPFNIVTDLTEDRVAFSSEQALFLADSSFNIIWEEDLAAKCFEFRRSSAIGDGLTYLQQKHKWAFDLLEINPESDSVQIKKAFRIKALQWHPDRHSEENKKNAEKKEDRKSVV